METGYHSCEADHKAPGGRYQEVLSINEDKASLKKTLLLCLKRAGRIIERDYGKVHDIRKKGRVSIVTETDLAAEHEILSILRKSCPAHRILTEESDPVQNDSPYRWIIDPVDGTTNFAHQLPLCSVSIALEHDGKVTMGGVYNPILKEFFFAERGKGATLNGRRIRVSGTKVLVDSLFVTGFPYDRQEKADYYLKFFSAILKNGHGIRRFGSAAIDLCYVACGKFDSFWEANLKPWDIAAGVLIVNEAGGRVTDFSGKSLDIDRPEQVLCSNSRIHKLIVPIFKKICR